MKWLDKLERKYGKYAIPNLMYYVIILYIVGFVIIYCGSRTVYGISGSRMRRQFFMVRSGEFLLLLFSRRTAVTFLSCLHCICII